MVIASAQEHLEFKGIPLDGSTSDFIKKLTDAGFKHQGKDDDSEILTGTFTGKECAVYIQSSPVSKTVHSAYVILSQETDWRTLKADYSTLKKGLTAKYGEPTECKEEFTNYRKEGDGNEYLAFKNGDAKWYSTYNTPLGEISLYIREQSLLYMTVIVSYVDKINSEKSIQELTEDL